MKSSHEEGGWGWVIAVSAFALEVITFGNVKALGVLAETVTAELDTRLWLTGAIISTFLAVHYLEAPLVNALVRSFGARRVLLVGGAVATAGWLLAALSSDIYTWGLFMIGFAGVGSGCFKFCMFSVLAEYFNKHYATVYSVACAGMSVGTILYGPVVQILLDTYGWRRAMALIGALTFNLVACAAAIRPRVGSYSTVPSADDDGEASHHRDRGERAKRFCSQILAGFDAAALRNVKFLLTSLAASMVAFSFVGWAVYVVPHGIERGLTPMESTFLPTAYGLGNLVGKIVAAVAVPARLLDNRLLMVTGMLLASVMLIVDPFLATLHGLISVSFFIGINGGLSMTIPFIIYKEMASDGNILGFYSWQGLFFGVAQITSGFISGLLYESTGSFTATFIFLGFVQFLSVAFLAVDYVCISKATNSGSRPT